MGTIEIKQTEKVSVYYTVVCSECEMEKRYYNDHASPMDLVRDHKALHALASTKGLVLKRVDCSRVGVYRKSDGAELRTLYDKLVRLQRPATLEEWLEWFNETEMAEAARLYYSEPYFEIMIFRATVLDFILNDESIERYTVSLDWDWQLRDLPNTNLCL